METAQGAFTADTISTTTIDSLPHWFALVENASFNDGEAKTKFDWWEKSKNCQAAITIERSLRDLWQQVLWEPYELDSQKLIFTPISKRETQQWDVWMHRQYALNSQYMFLDKALGDDYSTRESLLRKTVSEARVGPRGHHRQKVSKPTRRQKEAHHSLFEIVENSYLGPFLDAQLPSLKLTVRDFFCCWLILKDWSSALIKSIKNFEMNRRGDIGKLAPQVSVAEIVRVLAAGTGLPEAQLEKLLPIIVVDPTNLGDCFKQGCWYRPLVQVNENRVVFLLATLEVADPVYVLERLFAATNLHMQIENNSLGVAYESAVRKSLTESCKKNKFLHDTFVSNSGVDFSNEGGEEIDLLIRCKSVVMVVELKCFVRPVDPIDRYDYIEKLEGAAVQAAKKAEWAAQNREKISPFLGDVLDVGELKFLPMVALNNSAGVGLEINGVPVTDVHWLRMLLANTSVNSGGIRDRERKVYVQKLIDLYHDEYELAANFSQLCVNVPTLEKFRVAMEWTSINFPTADGSSLMIERPQLSRLKMIEAERDSGRNGPVFRMP